MDNCDNVQGFVVNHSVGGGTCSVLGTLILEICAVDYRKKSKLGFEAIHHLILVNTCIIETYSALLSTHWLLDHTIMTIITAINWKLNYKWKI